MTKFTNSTGTWITDNVTMTFKEACAAAAVMAKETGTAVTLDRLPTGGVRLIWRDADTKPAAKASKAAAFVANHGLTDAAVAKLGRTTLAAGYVAHQAADRAGGHHIDLSAPNFSTFDRYLETDEAVEARETEMARLAERDIDNLDRQLDADAAFYTASVRAKLTVRFETREAAVAFAKRVKGSMKASKETANTWVVTYTGNKLVARDGDAAFVAKTVEPGLLHSQRDDSEYHGECSCVRCCPEAARDQLMASQLV